MSEFPALVAAFYYTVSILLRIFYVDTENFEAGAVRFFVLLVLLLLADVLLAYVPLADVLLADELLADVLLADVLLAYVPLADVLLADVLLADVLLADVLLADVLKIMANGHGEAVCCNIGQGRGAAG